MGPYITIGGFRLKNKSLTLLSVKDIRIDDWQLIKKKIIKL